MDEHMRVIPGCSHCTDPFTWHIGDALQKIRCDQNGGRVVEVEIRDVGGKRNGVLTEERKYLLINYS